MKFAVGIVLSLVAAIHGAVIPTNVAPFVAATNPLFEKAWEYQALFTDLQQDINLQLTMIRTSVSGVLKKASNETLGQIETNAKTILADEEPVRDIIYQMDTSLCVNTLKTLLNSITEFTGFGSSNCVTRYDKSVEAELLVSYGLLQNFEGMFSEVQQIVVKSFIGLNAFLQPEIIQARFESEYKKRSEDWEKIRPDIEAFVKSLSGKITTFNKDLGQCFNIIQEKVQTVYESLSQDVEVCVEFDNTSDPFAVFRTTPEFTTIVPTTTV